VVTDPDLGPDNPYWWIGPEKDNPYIQGALVAIRRECGFWDGWTEERQRAASREARRIEALARSGDQTAQMLIDLAKLDVVTTLVFEALPKNMINPPDAPKRWRGFVNRQGARLLKQLRGG
jgi:hypothetical protein